MNENCPCVEPENCWCVSEDADVAIEFENAMHRAFGVKALDQMATHYGRAFRSLEEGK